ncbi:hypothetical protein HYT45_00835 [Candidatus Uhrbacteria bacterium]|nr:hypothetical protein [Candidatus Uhrbacteria bacterium]
MQNPKIVSSRPTTATQRYLDISEIKDDAVILKDGSLRVVLICSSINFALKSEDEQNALISAYVGFLNSLDFPIQVVVQSRRLNIEDYIERLKAVEKQQKNELLRVQIADYRTFIAELVSLGQIMSKRFYAVVPYSPLGNKRKGFFARFSEALSPALSVKLREERFQEKKKDMMLRVNQVISGLASMSVQAVQLDSQGLIELYYNVYNPDIFESQPLAELGQLRVEQR